MHYTTMHWPHTLRVHHAWLPASVWMVKVPPKPCMIKLGPQSIIRDGGTYRKCSLLGGSEVTGRGMALRRIVEAEFVLFLFCFRVMKCGFSPPLTLTMVSCLITGP